MRCFPVDGGGRILYGHFLLSLQPSLEVSFCFRPSFSISFFVCVLHVIFRFLLFFCPSNLNSNLFRKPSSHLKTCSYHLTPLVFHLIHGLIQSQHIHQFIGVLPILHFHSTYCPFHFPFRPSQNCKFFLPQAPCLASIKQYFFFYL